MNHTEHANYRSAALADLILGRIGDGTDFVADERVTFEQVPLLAEQQTLKSNLRLLPYMQHSFWFLPSVAACHAMANLLREKHNVFWHDYEVLGVAGADAGIGLAALPPVRKAIGSGSTRRRSPCRAGSSRRVSPFHSGCRS
jgi:hypothetical protein